VQDTQCPHILISSCTRDEIKRQHPFFGLQRNEYYTYANDILYIVYFTPRICAPRIVYIYTYNTELCAKWRGQNTQFENTKISISHTIYTYILNVN